MTNVLKINTDGGARGNPGPSASAFVVTCENKIIYTGSKYLGKTTNNIAEYTAVVLAVNWLKENYAKHNCDKVAFYLDSELVVKQLNGTYKIKNKELIKLSTEVKSLINDLPIAVSFNFVYREENKEADGLVNKEIDENTVQFHVAPSGTS